MAIEIKEKVRCWRCGGNVVEFGYGEEGCLQCSAPYDGKGNPIYPTSNVPDEENPLHSPRFGKNGGYL